MTHHHHHPHSHSLKSHDSDASQANIGLACLVNAAFAIVELVGGIAVGSVAVLSDALHDFGDSVSLGLAYVLHKKSKSSANHRYSYGYGRVSLISAAMTGAVLLAGSISILVHAIPRLWNPSQPHAEGMIFLAFVGISVNGFLAWKVHQGGTLNERVLSWHLLEDVLGWIITLVVAIVMKFYNMPILDPILSILFTGFILWGVLKTTSETIKLFLQGTPTGLDVHTVSAEVLKIQGIKNVHDVHVWSLDGEKHVMTLHAVIPDRSSSDDWRRIKNAIRAKLQALGRVHATIELEFETDDCPDIDCVPS